MRSRIYLVRPMRTSVALFLATVVTVVAQVPVRPDDGRARAIAVYAPNPNYPQSLKKRGIGGRGDFDMHVNVKTGQVISVDVVKSTGVRALDESCINAFQQWRFVPTTVRLVHCPVRVNPPGRSAVSR